MRGNDGSEVDVRFWFEMRITDAAWSPPDESFSFQANPRIKEPESEWAGRTPVAAMQREESPGSIGQGAR